MSVSGWNPDSDAVSASEQEQSLADAIEDESLTKLHSAAQTDGADLQAAKQIRAGRQDVRLAATAEEQARANATTEAVTWILVGIGGIIVLGGIVFGLLAGSFF